MAADRTRPPVRRAAGSRGGGRLRRDHPDRRRLQPARRPCRVSRGRRRRPPRGGAELRGPHGSERISALRPGRGQPRRSCDRSHPHGRFARLPGALGSAALGLHRRRGPADRSPPCAAAGCAEARHVVLRRCDVAGPGDACLGRRRAGRHRHRPESSIGAARAGGTGAARCRTSNRHPGAPRVPLRAEPAPRPRAFRRRALLFGRAAPHAGRSVAHAADALTASVRPSVSRHDHRRPDPVVDDGQLGRHRADRLRPPVGALRRGRRGAAPTSMAPMARPTTSPSSTSAPRCACA